MVALILSLPSIMISAARNRPKADGAETGSAGGRLARPVGWGTGNH